jgi:hypothetical protein
VGASSRRSAGNSTGSAVAHARTHEGYRRYSVARFLCALVLLFVTSPFLRHLNYGELIETGLGTLVLLSGVFAIGGRRRTLVAGAALVTPAVAGRWIDHLRPGLIPQGLILLVIMCAVGFVVYHLLRFVLRAPRVNSEVLCAGIATYLMLGILWSFVYTLTARLAPGSFVFSLGPEQYRSMVGFEALYFSFGALSGVNFGDITPVSSVARMLAQLEAMAGMFYLAVLISRLVSLYTSDKPLNNKGS